MTYQLLREIGACNSEQLNYHINRQQTGVKGQNTDTLGMATCFSLHGFSFSCSPPADYSKDGKIPGLLFSPYLIVTVRAMGSQS